MQHGYGLRKFLKKSYLEDRQKALEDRTKFTAEELDRRNLDVNRPGEGGGRTNPDTYKIDQDGFPIDQSVRKRKKNLDIREILKKLGG